MKTSVGKWLILCSAFVSGLHVAGAQGVPDGQLAGPGRVTKSAARPQGVTSPIPAALTSAHTLFLSNAGSDAGLFPHPFTGTQDRAYGAFYKALQANASFAVVDKPLEADLVLQLELTAPPGAIGADKKSGTEDALPTFKLVVFDRPSHYVLWTFSQTIDKANLQKTHDKNFDDALDLLTSQLFSLLGFRK